MWRPPSKACCPRVLTTYVPQPFSVVLCEHTLPQTVEEDAAVFDLVLLTTIDEAHVCCLARTALLLFLRHCSCAVRCLFLILVARLCAHLSPLFFFFFGVSFPGATVAL